MTQHAAQTQQPPSHQEVWDLLPWYVNNTLHDQERLRVETHLTACSACQAELRRCRALATEVRTAAADAWVPTATDFARLMARIDATTSPTPSQPWWARGQEHYRAFLRLFQTTPAAIRWALAGQGALIVLLAGGLAWQTWQIPDQKYRTLTSVGHTPASPHQMQVRLVFAEETTEHTLRALLLPLQGTMIAGPSPLGVYTVQVQLHSTAPEQAESVLSLLRAHPQVRLAEPLGGP